MLAVVRELTRTPSRAGEAVLLTGTWLVAALWVWFRLDEGWFAHDDGAFGQSATRVLAGELPHRDFVELYTGAMTFLNAGVFSLLGVDLFFLRLPVFLLFLGFVPCVYYLARQFVSPLAAALTTLAAVTWGYAVYPVPMPSWYVLFFAVYGAAALVRFRQTAHRRWLLVAGLLGGLAIGVKITGVYYVVAAVYFLLCCSPVERASTHATSPPLPGRFANRSGRWRGLRGVRRDRSPRLTHRCARSREPDRAGRGGVGSRPSLADSDQNGAPSVLDPGTTRFDLRGGTCDPTRGPLDSVHLGRRRR